MYRNTKNTFNTTDGRAIECGRKGGIRSGEVRRQKALKRETATSMVADIVYRKYLKDVTEEELRAFVRWRGQRKRSATLASKLLEDMETGESEEIQRLVDDLLEDESFLMPYGQMRKHDLMSGFDYFTFSEAVEISKDYTSTMMVLGDCIAAIDKRLIITE